MIVWVTISKNMCIHSCCKCEVWENSLVHKVLQKLKCQPNFIVLAESGKPSTSGKKPARKGVSRHIQAKIDEADEEDFSSHVHVPSDDDLLSSEAPSIPISTMIGKVQVPLDEQSLGPPPPFISDALMASSTYASTLNDNNSPAVSTSQTASR